jgi:GntR family transcriptional regulator
MRSQHDETRIADTSPHRVYELLRAGIRDGSIATGEQLMESLLVKTYGASRNSVRRALQMLADQGLLSRERRTGTNLKHEFIPIHAGEIGPRAWSGTSYDGRLRVQTLLCTATSPSPDLRRRLQNNDGQVILIEQLGTVDDRPLYFRTGFVALETPPADLVQRLESVHQHFPPLSEVFETVHGRAFGGTSYSVEAVAANERVAHELQIQINTPTLLRELTTFDAEGTPGELSFTYFAPGRAVLSGGLDATLPARGANDLPA